jgi:hypothetical protein
VRLSREVARPAACAAQACRRRAALPSGCARVAARPAATPVDGADRRRRAGVAAAGDDPAALVSIGGRRTPSHGSGSMLGWTVEGVRAT